MVNSASIRALVSRESTCDSRIMALGGGVVTVHTVHVYGEMCPAPLIKAEQKLREMVPGDLLVMESDHSYTVRLLREHPRRLPCRFSVTQVATGIWQFQLERR